MNYEIMIRVCFHRVVLMEGIVMGLGIISTGSAAFWTRGYLSENKRRFLLRHSEDSGLDLFKRQEEVRNCTVDFGRGGKLACVDNCLLGSGFENEDSLVPLLTQARGDDQSGWRPKNKRCVSDLDPIDYNNRRDAWLTSSSSNDDVVERIRD